MEEKLIGVFFFFSIFNSGCHFVQRSRTIWAILLENWAKIGSGSHFVQWSGTILAILEEDHSRNISVKLFWNQAIGLGGDVI